MKYSETGFRPLYHNFCIFPMVENVKKVAEVLPGYDEADGVLTYGYYDRQCGFTLDVLCCVKKAGDDQYVLAPESEDKRAMIRIGAVADTEYEFMAYGNDPLKISQEEFFDG